MTDDGDDVNEKEIKRNGRCITRKRRRVILGVVRNKTLCLICRTVMSAAHKSTLFNHYQNLREDKFSAPRGKLGEYELKKLKCCQQQ
jgi:hypothetical protein